MPDFIRAFVPGGTFFFTLVTYRRRPLFRDAGARGLLRRSIVEVQRRRPFKVEGMVLLPDHLHCVMVLPKDDADFSTRLRKIKEGFTRSYLASGKREAAVTSGQAAKGLRGVWQQRFWEHSISDYDDFARHMNYIHFNPVRHGLATCPHGWPWSTFAKWVRAGVYRFDWLCGCKGGTRAAPDFSELNETAME